MKRTQTGWWMALALAGLLPGVTRGQASLTGLGVPEGEEAASVAAQVSSDGGAVVGSEMVFDEVWEKRTDRPVRWQNGQRLAIPLPENSTGRASGVSIQGVTVVGTFHRLILRGPDGQPMGIAEWKAMMESADESLFENGFPDMEEYQGPFRWTPVGGFEALPMPEGAEVSGGVAVSADGSTVVGYMDSADGIQAFRWTTEGGTQGLGFFPGGIESRALAANIDGRVIVGFAHHADGIRAFRWTVAEGMQNLGMLEGGTFSRAAGVSADGSVVVGGVEYEGGRERAFRWTAATGMVELTPPEGTRSWVATAVSANGGTVVGQMSMEAGGSEAFVWDAAHGMRSVKSVLAAANVEVGEWRLDIAMGVSADGRTIVGAGVHPAGRGEAWRAVLPAP
jgi:probable HAF family extracellular repeat protein